MLPAIAHASFPLFITNLDFYDTSMKIRTLTNQAIPNVFRTGASLIQPRTKVTASSGQCWYMLRHRVINIELFD